jgi:uncharacterized LabA/DUF88 family protein
VSKINERGKLKGKMNRVALLIDMDNVNNEINISRLFSEINRFGELVYKYAFYSNFNDKHAQQLLQSFGLIPIMQPAFKEKKSCSDIRLAIEAMDMLQGNKADIYVIASNDSDFITLSDRIKKEKKKVIIATDKETFDRNYYKYFDESIDIFKLINSTPPMPKAITSDKKELSISEGIKDENTSTNANGTNSPITTKTDNSSYVDFNDENPKINDLLNKISNAVLNLSNDENFAQLNMVVLAITGGSKFVPKDYDNAFPNNRVAEFFKIRLKKYIETKLVGSTVFIKIKSKEGNE